MHDFSPLFHGNRPWSPDQQENQNCVSASVLMLLLSLAYRLGPSFVFLNSKILLQYPGSVGSLQNVCFAQNFSLSFYLGIGRRAQVSKKVRILFSCLFRMLRLFSAYSPGSSFIILNSEILLQYIGSVGTWFIIICITTIIVDAIL